MKKILIVMLLTVIIAIAGCADSDRDDSDITNGDDDFIVGGNGDSIGYDRDEDMIEDDDSIIINGGAKEFNVVAKKWEFIPGTIEVNEGDKVVLNIENLDVDHGFAISEFGLNEFLEAGETKRVEFVADKKGEYKFYCSVPCGSGHKTMDGTLVVK